MGTKANTPSELVFTIADAEAGVEGDTLPALGTGIEASLVAFAFGCSLMSCGGSPRPSDLAGIEAVAPPSLCSEDRGSSDLWGEGGLRLLCASFLSRSLT